MKAAVVRSFDRPLEIADVPVPEPGAEQVLVRIEACGLCHTDIHGARRVADQAVSPFIPGHEGVGIVERVGPGNPTGLRSAIASRCRGSATPAATAATATRVARRCVQHQINTGYAHGRGVRRVRRRLRAARRPRPGRRRPARCGTADVCRRHDLQGREGVGSILGEPRRRVRSRGSRSPRRAVRADHGCLRRRGRHERRSARVGARARSRAPRARRRGGSGRGDPAAWRRRRRDLDGGQARARSSRPSGRSPAGERSSASACRPTTRCASRSSRRCSAASTSAARSSAPTAISRRSSRCTRAV